MKKLMIAVVMVAMLVTVAVAEVQTGFNAQGSALVPGLMARHRNANYYIQSNLIISNITDSAVTCRVMVFDHDGNDISSYCYVTTGDNSTEFKKISTGVNSFEIPAHSTRGFYFFKANMQKSVLGHAVIEWTSDNKRLRKALIASSGLDAIAGQYYSNRAFVNNGQPF